MLSPGRLVALRAAIVADFKLLLPEVRSIENHFGPFDADELRAFMVRAPAVRVSLLGWSPSEDVSTRELDCEVHLAAYIVTKPQDQRTADEIAIDIAEALAGRLPKKSYTAWSEWATKIGCRNHYAGAMRETGGLALFSLDWHCRVRIGVNAPAARYASEAAGGPLTDVSLVVNGGDPVALLTPED